MKSKFVFILLLFVSIFTLNSFAKNKDSVDISLKLNEDYENSLLADIKASKKSIYCVVYLIKANTKKNKDAVKGVLDELIKAHKRGVKVTIIADRNQTFWEKDEKKKKEVHYPSKEALAYLKKAGITVYVDKTDKITHNKVVVIDDKILHVGSSNWTFSAFRRNNESNLRVVNAEVARELRECMQQIKVEPYDKNLHK